MRALLNTAGLAALLGGTGATVLDATYRLPTDPADARAGFEAAQIPGAGFMDLAAFADPDAAVPLMAPSAARFAALAGALGITERTPVVVYDQQGLYSAARAWWLFRLFGHAAPVAVLDGGLPAWRAAGLPIAAGAAARAAPALYQAGWRPSLLRERDAIAGGIGGNTHLLLDARPADRFAGRGEEPWPGLRKGHVPGSRNLDWRALLTPDQRLLPPDILRARFVAVGADAARPLVASCGAGVTACILALAAEVAGLPEVAVYDGSWAEWGARPDSAINQGP